MAVMDSQRMTDAGRLRGTPPLRGTQSFVSVMAQIWKRPGLLAVEVLWRWIAGLPLLLLLWMEASRALRGVPFALGALEAMTVFKPTEAAATMHAQLALTVPPLLPLLRWWVPLALLVWNVAAAWGRTFIWRRLDPSLRPRIVATFCLGLVRSFLFGTTLVVWVWGLLAACHYAVTGPAAAGQEPNLVLLMALAVALSLLLFMAWSLSSWVLDVTPLFAMTPLAGVGEAAAAGSSRGVLASLRAAWHHRALCSKLMETNLVMGIVKVALLVLALVFSASPLPFASVETNNFLAGWWSFVGAVYLVFSDLFQVIRRAAYLRLFQAMVTPETDIPSGSRSAS